MRKGVFLAMVGVALAVAGVVRAEAKVLSCEAALRERSGSGDKEAWLRAVNMLGGDVRISWIKKDGTAVDKGRVASKKTWRQTSTTTHVFVAKEASGACVCGFVADGYERWTIDAQGCRAEALFEPTSSYTPLDFNGWQVLVSQRLYGAGADMDKTRDQILAKLKALLAEMEPRLSPQVVRALKPTKIWLEREDEVHEGAVYHAALSWLRENDYNPDKLMSIQFSAATFLERSEVQPARVLHEYSHAYLDQFFGEDLPELLAAYQSACKRGIYRDVKRNNNTRGPAYALNGQQEYFAELSEAYLWENDYEPFKRAELETFDPDGAAVVARLWGSGDLQLVRRKREIPQVSSTCKVY